MRLRSDASLIVFDLDGTLFRTDTVTIPAVRDTCADFDIRPPTAEKVCSFFGKPHSEFHAWLRTIGPKEGRMDAFLETIDEREVAYVRTVGRLYSDVPEILKILRGLGNELAICTNGEHTYVHEVLEAHGIASFFSAIRHRERSNETKPDMLGDLINHLGASSGCVIGDRSDDMDAALRNDFLAVAAGYGYGSPLELKNAHIIAHSVRDIPRCIIALLKGRELSEA